MTSPTGPRFAVAAAVAFAVGILIALQARVNGALSIATGDGIEAAIVSFGSGWVILTVMVVALRPLRQGMGRLTQALREGELSRWQLIGGFIGGLFVAVQSVTVPLLGVAIFLVAIVAGQSTSSIVVDRIGLGPGGRRSITVARVVAAILATLAVLVSVSDRLTGEGRIAWPAVLAAFLIGCGIAIQQALNGNVAQVSRSPMAATWVNFTVGSVLLGVLLGLAWAWTDVDPGALPTDSPWMYVGGVIGIVFIAGTAWVVQWLGVLIYALLSIAGQLICALLLDWLAPAAGATMHATLLVGIALAGLAVLVGSLPAWAHRTPLPLRRGT